MKTVVKRGFVLIVAVVLLFTAAFQPRVKAVGPGTIAVVAGVAGALAFSAAWLAYARANGVDLGIYNMLSGQDLVDAITDLVQQYLNDERDGISANTYFDSIGIPSIVKFAYDTAGSYLAGGVKAIVSALGVATVFEPFLNWFTEKYSNISSSEEIVYNSFSGESGAYAVLSDGSRVFYSLYNGGLFDSSITSSVLISDFTLGTPLYTFSSEFPISYNLGDLYSFRFTLYSTNYGDRRSSGVFFNNPPSGNVSGRYYYRDGIEGQNYYLVATDKGVGFLAFNEGAVSALVNSYVLWYPGPSYPYPLVFIPWSLLNTGGIVSVSASQQEDDGTNRYPSTSIPSGKQLEIPVSIPNVSTNYPAASDTEEQQSNDIANAIIAGQVDNDFSVTTSDVVIADESATPTAAPTAVPTTVPSAVPSPVPSVTPIPEEYTPDITMFFPFCIPFDMYRLVGVFLGEPQAPVIRWEFTIPIIRQEPFVLEIDLSPYDDVASLLRKLETVAFVVGLAVATRKFISW